MTGVEIPIDEEAERIVAGLAAVGRNIAREVLSHCSPTDFYFPRNGRIVEHALDAEVLAAEDAAEPFDRLEARVVALAEVANVPLTYLRERAELDAEYGRRFLAPRLVRLAALKRRSMQAGADIYNLGARLNGEDLAALTGKIEALRDEIADLEQQPRLILVAGGAV